MSKRITVTLYEFPELTGAARKRASHTIEERLYGSFSDFAGDSSWDFFERVPGGAAPVAWEQLPAGDYIQAAFRDEYRFHGARQGRYVREAFEDFVRRRLTDYIPDEDDIAREAESAKLLFFKDGRQFVE